MTQWDQQFAALEIPFLRSAFDAHPAAFQSQVLHEQRAQFFIFFFFFFAGPLIISSMCIDPCRLQALKAFAEAQGRDEEFHQVCEMPCTHKIKRESFVSFWNRIDYFSVYYCVTGLSLKKNAILDMMGRSALQGRFCSWTTVHTWSKCTNSKTVS